MHQQFSYLDIKGNAASDDDDDAGCTMAPPPEYMMMRPPSSVHASRQAVAYSHSKQRSSIYEMMLDNILLIGLIIITNQSLYRLAALLTYTAAVV